MRRVHIKVRPNDVDVGVEIDDAARSRLGVLKDLSFVKR